MRLNRLINNANIILNSNNFRKQFLTPSPSVISMSNNNDNKRNISMTTNASVNRLNSPRNNIHIAIPTSPKSNIHNNLFLDNKLPRSSSLALFSPLSSRVKKRQLYIMQEADDILKDRLKNKNIIISNTRKYSKYPALKLKKDISLKNYIINILQEKRTDINEKERLMNNALKEFAIQFNIDYKTFMEYVEDVKKKQKIVDDLINSIKVEKNEKEQLLNEKMFEYKRLEDYIEKMLKLIYTSNQYAIFFHKVFNLPFNYNNIPELNRNYDFEQIANIIIDIYEKKDKNVPLPAILKDENVLTQKYKEMEDIILHCLANRDLIVKEISNNNENYKKDIKIVENNYKEYEKDLSYLKEELRILKNSVKNLKVQDTYEIDDFIEYILELGKEITDKIPIKNIKNNNNSYLLYCRKVLLTLEEKEVSINKYINEIESILNFGEKKDKNLVENCIMEVKKINKKENQLKLKRRQEQLENEKNLRYMKRAQKIVVKGRQASPIFPLIKHAHKIKKIKLNENNDEIEYAYSVTDEEK